ncbi:MAG: hypothetical protein FJW32_27365 [Acidobacteria bacterium]|nr:hypothetical protein [Acidobacteriota bacterium]
MRVFVAIIDTYDEQVAVGVTGDKATREAARMAHAYLKRRDALTADTSTPRKVADYFGVCVYEVEVAQ